MGKLNFSNIERVSSTEVQRNVGYYFHESLKKPILITNHNRDTHALISIDEFIEYQKLKDKGRVALSVNQLTEDDFQSIMAGEIPPDHDPERK